MSVTADRGSAPVRDGYLPPIARTKPLMRRRSLPMIAIGILCTFGGALGFGLIYLGAHDRQAVLVVARTVEPGELIRDSHLRVARIAADEGLRPIAERERGSVVGRRAAVALAPGTLITRSQIGDGPRIAPGFSAVGLSLKPGQFPPGLEAGDRVMLIVSAGAQTPAEGTARPPVIPEAQVLQISPAPDHSGSVLASVLVPTPHAPDAARAAAAGQASLALVGS